MSNCENDRAPSRPGTPHQEARTPLGSPERSEQERRDPGDAPLRTARDALKRLARQRKTGEAEDDEPSHPRR